MQKCPKCGYSEGFDWPNLFSFLALVVLSLGVEFLSASKTLRFLCFAVFCSMVLVSILWRRVREKKNRERYLNSETYRATEAALKS
jgi:membrane protein implicated in regulation of membrane protease activity